MTQIINASGNVGFLKSQTMPVVLVDSNGNIIDSLGSSGTGSGNVVGPASSLDSAIALFDGTTGKLLKGSNYLINGITLSNSSGVTIDSAGITTVNGATYLNLQSNGNIYLDAVGGTVEIQDSNFVPFASGSKNVGSSTKPFKTVYSNQFATTLTSGVGGNTTIDWNNGTTQILNFIGVASGTYTIGFANGLPGSAYVLETIQNTSGTCSLAWSGTQAIWQGGVSGTMTAASETTDMFSFFYNGNKYLGSFSNNYF